MRISVTIFVILISTCIVNASVLDPVIENVVHLKASKPPSGVAGIWKKKTIWKPRWVKEWKSAKVMKPVWKKVWSPVQIREWVPIPKPPPGWDSISTPLVSVHPKLPKAPIKDSTGHDSYTVHTSTKIPLWDPVPYPESQQPPPPPPFPQPLHNADPSCDTGECDNSHSATFNHQQISEIIGSRYSAPEYYQNNEYSETVNHLTRLPPEGNSWRPPLPDFQTENRFNSFPGLPEFLVPPTIPDFRLQANQNRQQLNNQPIPSGQVSHSAGFEPQGLRQWTPPPSEVKIKGHLVTKAPDHPYKFQFPEVKLNPKNGTKTGHKEAFSNTDNELKEKPNFQAHNVSSSFRPPADGDFIQEAHLVGEYHYSEFDLPNVKQESKKPEVSAEESDHVKAKPQQSKALGPNLQKPKVNQQSQGENRPIQNRTENKQEVRHPQNGQHVQKKHISDISITSSNSNFFQQQKAILKEIFPMHNFPTGRNDSLIPQNHGFELPLNDITFKKHLPVIHPSTLSATTSESSVNSSNTNVRMQQQTETYPIYEIPQIKPATPTKQNFSQPPTHNFNTNLNINRSFRRQKENYPIYEIPSNHRFSLPFLSNSNALSANKTVQEHKENDTEDDSPIIPTDFPPNHRFSSPADVGSQKKLLRLNHYTTRLLPVATAPDSPTKTGKSSFERNASVQLVFPTTPVAASDTLRGYPHTAEDSRRRTTTATTATATTTTEPYSVIFSSSFLSTTETVTRSPLVIVTPATQSES